MPEPDYEVLEKTTGYDGYFRIDVYTVRYRLHDGGWSKPVKREVFERGHAAAVIPYDPVCDAVVLIEQFRIGAIGAPGRPWLLEIVAGIIEAGESAEEVARREALEEAGCTLLDLVPICDYLSSPGGASERVSLFCGRVDASEVGGIHGVDEEGEDIRAFVLPFDKALREIMARPVQVASLMIAIQWLALNRARLRARWAQTAR